MCSSLGFVNTLLNYFWYIFASVSASRKSIWSLVFFFSFWYSGIKLKSGLRRWMAKWPFWHSAQQCILRVSPANFSHLLPLCVCPSVLEFSPLQALHTPPDFPDSPWLLLSRPHWGRCLQNQLKQVQGSPYLFLIPRSSLFPGAWCSHSWRGTMGYAWHALSIPGWGGSGRLYLPFCLSYQQNQSLECESQHNFFKIELVFLCKIMSFPEFKTPQTRKRPWDARKYSGRKNTSNVILLLMPFHSTLQSWPGGHATDTEGRILLKNASQCYP